MFLATFSSHQWAHCAHYLMYKFLLSSNVQKYFQFVFLLFFCFWGATQRINIFEKKKTKLFCYFYLLFRQIHLIQPRFESFFSTIFLFKAERKKKKNFCAMLLALICTYVWVCSKLLFLYALHFQQKCLVVCYLKLVFVESENYISK